MITKKTTEKPFGETLRCLHDFAADIEESPEEARSILTEAGVDVDAFLAQLKTAIATLSRRDLTVCTGPGHSSDCDSVPHAAPAQQASRHDLATRVAGKPHVAVRIHFDSSYVAQSWMHRCVCGGMAANLEGEVLDYWLDGHKICGERRSG